MLKGQLNEKTFKCEQLGLEKGFLEKQVGREKMEGLGWKRDCEAELGMLREQVKVLSGSLSLSEVKLISAEKEYMYLKVFLLSN